MTTNKLGPVAVRWLLVLTIGVAYLHISMPAAAFEGPLSVKNEFPLFMHLDSPRLESAVTVNSFSASLFYSSVFMNKQAAEWQARLDMEIAELNLRYTRQIGDLFELGVEVPVLCLTSGFMDSFLHGFHSAFGFADYGRQSRPNNSFLYEVRRGGVVIIRGEDDGIGLGDIKLSAKRMLFDRDPMISIKADVELPTGSASKGYGSGSPDAGLSLLIDKRLGEKIMTYYNMGVIFPGRLKAVEPVSLKTSGYGGVGLEAMVSPNISLIGQVMVQTSPFPKTGIGNIDRTGVLLALGGRYIKGNGNFEISFTEDPNTAGAPDFTINISYKKKF
jgi:hypothetical protein